MVPFASQQRKGRQLVAYQSAVFSTAPSKATHLPSLGRCTQHQSHSHCCRCLHRTSGQHDSGVPLHSQPV